MRLELTVDYSTISFPSRGTKEGECGQYRSWPCGLPSLPKGNKYGPAHPLVHPPTHTHTLLLNAIVAEGDAELDRITTVILRTNNGNTEQGMDQQKQECDASSSGIDSDLLDNMLLGASHGAYEVGASHGAQKYAQFLL